MRALVTVLAATFVLSQVVAAQVKFSTPGSRTEYTGKMFVMRETNVAKRRHASGSALVGYNSSSKEWAIRLKARNLKPNAHFVLALVGPKGCKVVGEPATSHSMGTLSMDAAGSFNPSDYTDIALYRRPRPGDKPQQGAIRLLSLRISSITDIRTGRAGAGQKKPGKAAKTH